MESSLRNCIATVLFAVPALGLVACANRGMEAPGEGGSGAVVGTGGSAGKPSGTGGVATGGSGGRGTGGVAGKPGTGGTVATGGTPGTGGVLGTGGAAGTGSGGARSSGGTSGGGAGGAAGAPATGGVGGGGAAGSGGRAGNGGAGNGGASGGSNQIISIDFVGGSVPTGGAGGGTLVAAATMTATETAGVKLAANWNAAANISGTLPNLRQSDGTVTTATVTWNSPVTAGNPGEWSNGYADAPGNTRMMNGYLDPTSSTLPATVKVSALPAPIAAGYDVYVYVYGNIPGASTRTYQYAIGNTTLAVSQTGPSPSTFPGFTLAPAGGAGSYVVFHNVSGTSFTLTATPGTGPQTRSPVNGLQIVWPPGS